MKSIFITFIASCFAVSIIAQIEPEAGNWDAWFISNASQYRLPAPLSTSEIAEVIDAQRNLDSADLQQIYYWNAGAPGYRWHNLVFGMWMTDTTLNGPLANMLVATAIYDATLIAWDTKYAYQTQRPYESDNRVKILIPKVESPGFPCEHSVAAGAASTIIAHFYPSLADSVFRMAQRVMNSRVNAGVAYPSDTRAGFALGKQIAEKEIAYTRDFITTEVWDGKRPDFAGVWQGEPMSPTVKKNKTVVLDSSSQFRPEPPPDFTKDMEELKKFKPTFRLMANAFLFASQPVWEDMLSKKIFEYNLHLNPPRAARIYAATAIGVYDSYISCWDAKYTYWGTRPDQYDTTYQPVLFFTPPFPGYPSGHAMIGSTMSELYAYFFPADAAFFRKRAKDGAESRFQGGIHFRSDNEVGLVMGKKVAALILEKVKKDGAGNQIHVQLNN